MNINWKILIVLMTLTFVKDSDDNFTRNTNSKEKSIVMNSTVSVNINSELGNAHLKHLTNLLNRLNVKIYYNISDVINKPQKN